MRWPWSRRKRRLLVVEEVAMPDERDASTDALRRARAALEKAETNGDAMHRVTKAIHMERQRNSFAPSIYEAMRRKRA